MLKAKFNVDPNARLPIPCPKCGRKAEQLVSRLRKNPKLRCPACSAEFAVDGAQLDKLLKAIGG
jgi:DNA-directed RNA polymerase subunit RPC12/RpoP